jgi:hypothetical protein
MEHWYGVDGECEIRWQQKKNKPTICDRVHGARAVTHRRMVDGYHVNDTFQK